MGKYVENNLQRGETIVKKAKITLVYAVCCLTNIFVIPLIVRLVKRAKTELAVTSRRVVGKVGVIKTQSLDAQITKVQNCSVKRTLGGRIFNYGTVVINTAAGEYFFPGVKDADKFKGTVMNQMEAYEEEKMKQQAAQMAQAMAGVINK